jgi:hypothetical protein
MMGDAATTTPTDPEQTALRDTMGRILLPSSLCVHPSPGGILFRTRPSCALRGSYHLGNPVAAATIL